MVKENYFLPISWPKEYKEKYQSKGFWTGETLSSMLKSLAQKYKDKIAIQDLSCKWSFIDLDKKASQLASGFSKLGLLAGDSVIVQLPNVPEFYAVLFGLIKLGVKPLLALPAHRSVEIKSFCKHLQSKAYIFPDTFNGFNYNSLAQEVFDECNSLKYGIVYGESDEFTKLNTLYEEDLQYFPEPNPCDVALFLLSGGSTGIPKVIPRTHNDYIYSFRESAKICRINENDVYLCVLPAAHNFALSSPGVLGCLYNGAKIVPCLDPSPKTAFELIESMFVTITALTPPLVRLWLETSIPTNFETLKLLQVGGALFDYKAAKKVFSRFGCKLQQVFGMAEGLVCYTKLDDPLEQIISAEVVPISDADEIKIVDDNQNEVPQGVTGNLLVRGPYTIRGYWDAPLINKTAFDQDGYYKTGDLVRKTQDGRLVVMGRTKDIINRGGEIFSPEEIELQLKTHPAVVDAAVFAEKNLHMGESSCAVLVTRLPLSPSDVRHYLRTKGLATFKIPDRIEFVDDLAKTAVGKIDKNNLRIKYSNENPNA